jgi:hypothetical protein
MAAKAHSDVTGFTSPDVRDEGPRRAALQAASGWEAPSPSPALMLQDALSAEMAAPQVRRWPPLATMSFVTSACGAFWLLTLWAILRGLGA